MHNTVLYAKAQAIAMAKKHTVGDVSRARPLISRGVEGGWNGAIILERG